MNVNTIKNDATIQNVNSSKQNTSSADFSKSLTKTYSYSDIFQAASDKYNVPKNLLEAVAMTESSFNPNDVSYCGATGLMQLMPGTAKSLGVQDSYDPVENVMGGAKYLSQMLNKYNGDTSLALAAYNGGPGNVAKYHGVPPFCESYVAKVNSYMNKGVTSPNKTVEVSSLSRAGQLMSEYTPSQSTKTYSNTTSNVADTSFLSNNTPTDISSRENDVLNVSDVLNTLSNVLDETSLLNALYKVEALSTRTQKLDLLQSLLNNAIEYNLALQILNNSNDEFIWLKYII